MAFPPGPFLGAQILRSLWRQCGRQIRSAAALPSIKAVAPSFASPSRTIVEAYGGRGIVNTDGSAVIGEVLGQVL